MKNKNQTVGQNLPELAKNAANEDGFSPVGSREGAPVARKPAPAWSPYEVWRTRMKGSEQQQPPVRRP
jgi:hypothetical protein